MPVPPLDAILLKTLNMLERCLIDETPYTGTAFIKNKYHIEFKNGLFDGTYKKWDSKGTIIVKGQLEKGNGVVTSFWKNGKKEYETTLKNNLRTEVKLFVNTL